MYSDINAPEAGIPIFPNFTLRVIGWFNLNCNQLEATKLGLFLVLHLHLLVHLRTTTWSPDSSSQ